MIRLRNLFIAGLLVVVPIFLTWWVLQLLFGFMDGFSQPLMQLYLGREIPGAGVVLTTLMVLILGYFSTLFVGQRLVAALEYWIARVPIVRSVYSTTRQVVHGFSSADGASFQRTVLVPREGDTWALGFVTQDFVLIDDGREQSMVSVFVPTNHLYLGDVLVVPSTRVVNLAMTLEQGISAVLSCGGSVPEELVVGVNAQPPAMAVDAQDRALDASAQGASAPSETE